MPKLTGTKIEKLEDQFRRKGSLTSAQLKRMFPDSQIASMIWHLEAKAGLKIEREKKGSKITRYTLTKEAVPARKRTWEPREPEHG